MAHHDSDPSLGGCCAGCALALAVIAGTLAIWAVALAALWGWAAMTVAP